MKNVEIIFTTKEKYPEKYIEPFLQLWQRNHEEEYPFPPPPLEYFRNSWNIGLESYRKELVGIILDEEKKAIGYLYSSWKIKYDNQDWSFVYVYIPEEWDSDQIRKQAIKVMLNNLPPQLKTITAWCELGKKDEDFLRSLKKQHSYEEVFSITHLSKINPTTVKDKAYLHRKRIEEKGYKVIYIDNANFFEYFDKYEICAVFQSIWNDMPRQDLTHEDVSLKPERLEEDINFEKMRGDYFSSYFIIDETTKKPIAYTTIKLNQYQPWLIWQQDTGVIQEYRGNALGLAVKYQMLERILENKEAKYLITGSNVENKYMRKINKQLGYVEFKSGYEFQFNREELEEKILSK